MAAITASHRAYYLLGLRRPRAQAKRERDALAVEFEAVNDEVHAELRALKNEGTRIHAIEVAIEAKRDEHQWLH
jgi:septal ring factor EnvC (AmiA/AmiB activator)